MIKQKQKINAKKEAQNGSFNISRIRGYSDGCFDLLIYDYRNKYRNTTSNKKATPKGGTKWIS
jgi:hypothetical protein